MPVEQKYPIKKIATQVISILGAIAAIISIYVFFFQEKKVDLQYEIVANTNVLDINAEVGRLDITYNGMSLKEKNEHLRIINLRVINRGNENILKEYFDDNDPVGFRVSQGKIIEKPELIDASSQYLKDNLQVLVDTSGRVRLSKVILESKEYIVLKLLVLHKSNNLPEIIPTGKVAGMKQINVINSLELKDQTPFFIQVFSGSLFVQTVRAVSYFLIVVLIIVVIILLSDKVSTIKKKHKRQSIVEEFKNLKNYNYSKMDDAIFERYVTDGPNLFTQIKELLDNDKLLNESYHKSLARLKKKEIVDKSNPEVLFTENLSLRYLHEDQ